MILPSKHVTISSSLLGLGALALDLMDQPITVDQLWHRFSTEHRNIPFERFVVTLTFLYAIKLLEMDDGLLRRRLS